MGYTFDLGAIEGELPMEPMDTPSAYMLAMNQQAQVRATLAVAERLEDLINTLAEIAADIGRK